MTLFSSSKQDSHHSSESNSELGLIPRICQTMFAKMQQSTDNSTTFRTEASYLEIYNEKVKDLLGPDANGTHGLKVLMYFFCILIWWNSWNHSIVDINYYVTTKLKILFEARYFFLFMIFTKNNQPNKTLVVCNCIESAKR